MVEFFEDVERPAEGCLVALQVRNDSVIVVQVGAPQADRPERLARKCERDRMSFKVRQRPDVAIVIVVDEAPSGAKGSG